MKDINTLTGIEFENLCQALLQKAGFDVETTKASGDGGIDLIARNHQSFFSGKYIIQCKRYAGSVGEPVVRDLYGVVMAERANKGILLTTGHFTVSAVRFASDKNLELIDGEGLSQLLSTHNLVNRSKPVQYDHFTQHECFNCQKYEFYKDKISKNQCSKEMAHDFLFDFMLEYIKMAGKNKKINAMLRAGFAKEYLQLVDWYMDKFRIQKVFTPHTFRLHLRDTKGIAQLLNFDLYDYVQDRYQELTEVCHVDINIRSKSDLDADTLKVINKGGKGSEQIMKNLVESGAVKLSFPEQGQDFYELMNLLGLFSFFKIESGVSAINKVVCGKHPHFKPWIETQKDYQCALRNAKFFYFRNECPAGSVNLTSYFTQGMESNKDKIQEEIANITKMMDALF